MTDPRHTLACCIKTYREVHGLTLKQFAEQCGGGVNSSTICHAENPETYPTGSRPMVSDRLDDVLALLGLTFAKDDNVPVQVHHVCMMIDKLPIRRDAKSMAIHAVHRAGMMLEEKP